METPTVTQAAEMLGQLSKAEVVQRIDDLHTEEKMLRVLLRMLRARETASHRREDRANG